jgi:phosphoribosylformimino-5-aminoimidazole carboxamide ribotide isomerase
MGFMFRVIPALDLKDGKVTRLRQGKEDEVTFTAENPVDVAEEWVKKGAKVLHVIDLDGAFQGRLKHEDVIREVLKFPVEVQVGGGLRDFEIAERLLRMGVKRVILGTIATEKIEEVREFAEKWKKRVMIAIDTKKGRVVVKGWKEASNMTPLQLAKLYDDLELSFLYTNVDVEGLVSGIEKEKISEIVRNLRNPVYVAGGVTSVDDVRFIKRVGAAGVVIGSALYTGKLKFEEVLKIEHEKV